MLGLFKILVLIHDGESKSYLARHPAFDRTIMLHVLPQPDSPEYGVLASYLERLAPNGRKMLLDRGAEDGAEYVVTERILDFHSLRAWLEKTVTQAPVSAPPPPPAASPAGEFTRLFQSAPPDPAPASSIPTASPTLAPPGEFTRLFSSSSAPTSQPPVSSQPVSSQPKKPGSFTKQFLALSETRPASEPQPAPAPPSKPGEFTAFFKAPLPSAPDPPPAMPPVPKPMADLVSAKPAFPQAGEFTRMFGDPLPVAVPPPPQPPAALAQPQPQLSYTAMFDAPPAAPPLPPPAISAPAVPTPPAALPQTAKAAPSNKVLIAIFVVLLVAALVLIGYFALKR